MLQAIQTKAKISELDAQKAALQLQIAALQAQFSTKEQHQSTLQRDLSIVEQLVRAVAEGREEISTREPLSDLKEALLGLFSDDTPDDDKGNQPISPAPQPGDDGGAEVAIRVVTTAPEPSEEKGKEEVSVTTAESASGDTPEQNYCEWASPLSTPLCCPLEDAPQSALQGQSVEIACVVSDAPKKPEYIELVPVNHEIAYQRRTHDGEIICCYVGFNNKTRAKQWGEFLAVHHSVAAGFQLRNSERLTDFKWEIPAIFR